MRIGAAIFPTDRGIHPAELARELEARGFESLWLPEHTHIPVSRRTPYPGGGDLPDYYARALDPFVALGAAATATTKLLLGTGVCLVIERDPIVLAKEVATLDWLSGGRALFGVGGGWNREEMRNHGTDPATRWDLMRERILAMKEIWTRDEAEFHGRFVDFGPIWSWPKSSARTRRSWSAATERRRSTASSSTATPGCRSSGRAAPRRSRIGSRSCAAAARRRAGRRCRSPSGRAAGSRTRTWRSTAGWASSG